jgi:protocatechuate 3,4-dioxygenase beta subunit
MRARGAVVEVWHTDADGAYSGYPQELSHDIWLSFPFVARKGTKRNGEFHVDPVEQTRFLRGLQRADADGWVEFGTVFQGWYEGRVPHIHFRVVTVEGRQFTSQFYLDQAVCDDVYSTRTPYHRHGPCPLRHDQDVVIGDAARGLRHADTRVPLATERPNLDANERSRNANST